MRFINSLYKKIILFLVNGIFAGTKCFTVKRILLTSIGWSIGDNTKIVAPLDCNGKLTVGSNTWIGKNLKIYGNGVVYIGSYCDLGPNVSFLTGGHAIGDEFRRAGKGVTYTISVQDGVWIGANSTLCGDIEVKKASIIAACAFVNKRVESNTIVGGVPAKIIRTL